MVLFGESVPCSSGAGGSGGMRDNILELGTSEESGWDEWFDSEWR